MFLNHENNLVTYD